MTQTPKSLRVLRYLYLKNEKKNNLNLLINQLHKIINKKILDIKIKISFKK